MENDISIALNDNDEGNSTTSFENLEMECPSNCRKTIKALLDEKAVAKKNLHEKTTHIKNLEEKLAMLKIKSSLHHEKEQLLFDKIKDKDDMIKTLKASIEVYKTMKTSIIKPDEIIGHILELKNNLSKINNNPTVRVKESPEKDIKIKEQEQTITQHMEIICQLQNELKACKLKVINQGKVNKSKVASYENTIKQLKDSKQETTFKNTPNNTADKAVILSQEMKINEHLSHIEALKTNLNAVKAKWDQLKKENSEFKHELAMYKDQVIRINTKFNAANETISSNDKTINELKSTIAKLKEKGKEKPNVYKEPSVSFQLMQIEGLKSFVVAYDDDLMDCNPKWMIIQRRFNGSISFDRFWHDYANGFGDNNREFWLGLNKLHVLTTSKRHELYIHFTDFWNQVRYARYDNFVIASEDEKYELSSLGSYTGNTGDIMRKYEKQPFDIHDSFGGWWYTMEHESHLNGQYICERSKDQKQGIHISEWYFGCSVPLKSVRMLIRPHNDKEK